MLDVKMEFKKGILVIKLRGDLTSDTSYIFEESFNKIVNKSGSKYILLNIENVDIIDKKGIDLVNECANRITSNNGKFIINGLSEIFNNYTNIYQVKEDEEGYGIVKL